VTRHQLVVSKKPVLRFLWLPLTPPSQAWKADLAATAASGLLVLEKPILEEPITAAACQVAADRLLGAADTVEASPRHHTANSVMKSRSCCHYGFRLPSLGKADVCSFWGSGARSASWRSRYGLGIATSPHFQVRSEKPLLQQLRLPAS
jgi:hypothetical protein